MNPTTQRLPRHATPPPHVDTSTGAVAGRLAQASGVIVVVMIAVGYLIGLTG